MIWKKTGYSVGTMVIGYKTCNRLIIKNVYFNAIFKINLIFILSKLSSQVKLETVKTIGLNFWKKIGQNVLIIMTVKTTCAFHCLVCSPFHKLLINIDNTCIMMLLSTVTLIIVVPTLNVFILLVWNDMDLLQRKCNCPKLAHVNTIPNYRLISLGDLVLRSWTGQGF